MIAATSSDTAHAAAHCHRVFEILTVCTANLCRSPMIEAQLRAGLDPRAGSWSVVSAGTEARAGLTVHPDSVRALARRGVALPESWRSRRLTVDDVVRADLVLTATRAHRGAVVRSSPHAAQYTFTLRQFARLLSAAEAPAPRLDHQHAGDALLRTAISARGFALAARPEDDDLIDPIGSQYAVFRELADTVAGAVTVVTSNLPIPR